MTATVFIRRHVVALALFLAVAGGLYWGFEHFAAPQSDVLPPNVAGAPPKAEVPHNEQVARAAAAQAQGRWEDVEDPRFVREIANGSCRDAYEGRAEDWQPCAFYSSDSVPSFLVPTPHEGTAYLVMGHGEDALAYAVTAVTPETLELIYMGRGNILRFAKLPDVAPSGQ